jgi:hypothetical protein
MSNTADVLSEAGPPYPLRAPGFASLTPSSSLPVFVVFCVVLFVVFVFVLCRVHTMVPVCLECPFLIVTFCVSNGAMCFLIVHS